MATDNYLGNPLIKKSNVRLNFTAEQIQEYGKCASDITYFIENYVKIVNIDLGLITFKLYPYQKAIVKAALEERFVICKLPRQSGKTTTVVGVILWHTLFYENYNVAILAHKAAQSRDILSRIQFAYEHLPKWMQQGVAEWNKGNIELENGSKILASATSSSAIRGGSYNCVSGNSNITILFNNKEFDITIDQLNILLANSSRNINITNNEIQDILLDEVDLDVFREQIHKNERSVQGKNSLEQRIEIKTANGFKKFRGIRKTLKQPVIRLILSCGNSIVCTPNHKISTTLGWKEAKSCGGFYVNTQYGCSNVDSIINANSTDVFDILHVEDENSFYANNILVHNCIYLDEFAFVPNALQEQFFASVYPTISSGSSSKVLITSTPNGLNLFYKLWADSQDGKNDYKGIEVHWSETPGRDEQWKQQTIRNTSEQQFRVEYGTEFLGSSNTLVDPAKLQTLVFTYPVKTVPYFGTDLKIYSLPIKNNKYIVTVDVAQGAGLDYSICQVIDISTVPYKQVATYKNNTIHTLIFPDVIRNIAVYFNSALILVEINDIGKQVVDSLHYDLEYEGILTVDKSIAAGQKLSGGFGARTQMGVRTTTQVKRIGCSNLKTLIESDKLLLCDFDTIEELFRFVNIRNSFQAEDGNDDLVMGLVLFSWLINQSYFKDLSNNDVHRVLAEAAMDDDLLPFIVDDSADFQYDEQGPLTISSDRFEFDLTK